MKKCMGGGVRLSSACASAFWYGLVWSTCYAKEILDAKYEKVEVDKVINQLNQLSIEQKKALRKVLKQHTKLFSGKLAIYPHRKFHVDLVPGP